MTRDISDVERRATASGAYRFEPDGFGNRHLVETERARWTLPCCAHGRGLHGADGGCVSLRCHGTEGAAPKVDPRVLIHPVLVGHDMRSCPDCAPLIGTSAEGMGHK